MRSTTFFIIILFLTACQSDRAKQPAKGPSVNESPIISERIDGPANMRETANGRLLFVLKDSTMVTTTLPQGQWVETGIMVDLTKEQLDSLKIAKGSRLFADGREVGTAIENIGLRSGFDSKDGPKGELTGFTSVSNIRVTTIPENVFSEIVNAASGSLTRTDLAWFLKSFVFTERDGILPRFKGYQINENWIDDPSPGIRLWLLFDNDRFYGLFHSRPLQLKNTVTTKLKYNYYFSSFVPDEKTNKELVNGFNAYIDQVD